MFDCKSIINHSKVYTNESSVERSNRYSFLEMPILKEELIIFIAIVFFFNLNKAYNGFKYVSWNMILFI